MHGSSVTELSDNTFRIPFDVDVLGERLLQFNIKFLHFQHGDLKASTPAPNGRGFLEK